MKIKNFLYLLKSSQIAIILCKESKNNMKSIEFMINFSYTKIEIGHFLFPIIHKLEIKVNSL